MNRSACRRAATRQGIKAVLFDIDGVLMDSFEANVAFYREFLTSHGYRDLDEADLAKGHYLSLREAIALISRAPENEVAELLHAARRLEGYPFELVRIPEGCRETLETLSETYTLGVVTSRIKEGVDQFFEFSGLEEYFALAVGYEDYPRPKPNPDPLLAACLRLNLSPDEVVYVGDAEVDRLCALSAGASFIGFGSAVPAAGHIVSSFAELELALKGPVA
jgi:HAD superfamily hydrolase (TIGR01549 family)